MSGTFWPVTAGWVNPGFSDKGRFAKIWANDADAVLPSVEGPPNEGRLSLELAILATAPPVATAVPMIPTISDIPQGMVDYLVLITLIRWATVSPPSTNPALCSR